MCQWQIRLMAEGSICVEGTDPEYGTLAGQGQPQPAPADVDGDGCMEIIYGAAVIDHDGSLLYSSYDIQAGWGACQVGDMETPCMWRRIDPDRPGYQIFNVFEGGERSLMDLPCAMHRPGRFVR